MHIHWEEMWFRLVETLWYENLDEVELPSKVEINISLKSWNWMFALSIGQALNTWGKPFLFQRNLTEYYNALDTNNMMIVFARWEPDPCVLKYIMSFQQCCFPNSSLWKYAGQFVPRMLLWGDLILCLLHMYLFIFCLWYIMYL